MTRPLLLDLFCGAGGAAMGYYRAGFDVVGVDINPQPEYPFPFIQADVLAFPIALSGFDAVHASPPCQAYSVLRRANIGAEYPDVVAPTREKLQESGMPWIIENVPGAPLLPSIVLCGSMFGLEARCEDGTVRQLRRHRLFEANVPLEAPACNHRGEAVGVYGGGRAPRWTFANGATKDPYGRRGGYQGTMREKSEAMGIDWMRGRTLTQAIPPAYTEWIGRQLVGAL